MSKDVKRKDVNRKDVNRKDVIRKDVILNEAMSNDEREGIEIGIGKGKATISNFTFQQWEQLIPAEITNDSLWRIKAYRLSLYVADVGWIDVSKLRKDRRTLGISDQLFRSLGSISANIAEGYSRSTGKSMAVFYEYALGSARESRDWYFKSRFVLGDEISNQRIQIITEIIRLLLTMIPKQRRSGRVKDVSPNTQYVIRNT